MSSFNPYLTPEDDSENIVGKDDEQSETTNENQSTQRHIIRGPNGEELPPEVQEALGRNLNTWDKSATSKMPQEFVAIQGLFEFFSSFPHFSESGALLQSIAEVVDTFTNGDLSRMYALHEAERIIMWTNSITRVEEFLHTIFEYSGFNFNDMYKAEMQIYLSVFVDMVKFFQEIALQAYNSACEDLGKEPDEEFLTSGILTERTHFQKICMSYPAAKRDV